MMDIQPIKNEKNYDKALAEIEALWGAEEGTEKGNKVKYFAPVTCILDVYMV